MNFRLNYKYNTTIKPRQNNSQSLDKVAIKITSNFDFLYRCVYLNIGYQVLSNLTRIGLGIGYQITNSNGNSFGIG